MYDFVRAVLIALSNGDDEKIDEIALRWGHNIQNSQLLLKLIARQCGAGLDNKPTRVAGIDFPNQVGTAAGVDKDGQIPLLLQAFGPGFITVGTVLPRYQPGNPRPRVFRVEEHNALINALGFNGSGSKLVNARLSHAWPHLKVPVIVSLGKMKDTPLERAADDYIGTMVQVWPHARAFTLCVSSPNTPGLRELQKAGYLRDLVYVVVEKVKSIQNGQGPFKPVFVKFAPDIDDTDVEQMIDDCKSGGASGVVLANTTVSREAIQGHVHADKPGGLSGDPVYWRMLDLVRMVRKIDNTFPIIAVGGISNATRAKRVIDAGADLIKVNTPLRYQGPRVIRKLKRALAA